MVVKIFMNEFNRFDRCTSALKKFGPYRKNFLDLLVDVPLGLVVLQFGKCSIYMKVCSSL